MRAFESTPDELRDDGLAAVWRDQIASKQDVEAALAKFRET
jgi:hypothetical protein